MSIKREYVWICKILGHHFKYIRRYYRCTRCGVRKYDLSKKRQERMISDSMGEER